jgi:hypothetical protein
MHHDMTWDGPSKGCKVPRDEELQLHELVLYQESKEP